MHQQDEILDKICLGNAHAKAFLLMLADISQVWDDLIDRDSPVADEAINRAFCTALIDLQYNPFYQAHQASLLPVMELAILNWQNANQHEKRTDEAMLKVSYIKRSVLTDIMVFVASLVGGRSHALALGPEIEAAVFRDDDFEAYLLEVKERRTVQDTAAPIWAGWNFPPDTDLPQFQLQTSDDGVVTGVGVKAPWDA